MLVTTHVECVCQLVRKVVNDDKQENGTKRKGSETGEKCSLEGTMDRIDRRIAYREEEIPDCGCIYG